jgi:hypothetical protein
MSKLTKMFEGDKPDITQAQVLAVIKWLTVQAIAWGAITNSTGQLVLSIGSTVLAAVWVIADSALRGRRARAKALENAAASAPIVAPPSGLGSGASVATERLTLAPRPFAGVGSSAEVREDAPPYPYGTTLGPPGAVIDPTWASS